jgi:hypothetical protein
MPIIHETNDFVISVLKKAKVNGKSDTNGNNAQTFQSLNINTVSRICSLIFNSSSNY